MTIKTIGIIPARGGSKAVPQKNIKLLNGKPLIAWTIEAAQASKNLSALAVSTDDPAIAAVAKQYGVTVIDRPSDIAGDTSPTRDAIAHAVSKFGGSFDAVVTLQPTSPFRTASDIDAAIDLFDTHPEADSLVSIIDVPHHFHPESVMRQGPDGYLHPWNGDDFRPVRRQDRISAIARNGAAIYITRMNCLNDYIFGGKMIGYTMPEIRSVDINGPDDFEMAAIIAAGMDHARKG